MATEKRLIDAIALKRHMIKAMELANKPTINEDELVYAIDNADTVDAEEVVHGRWEWIGPYRHNNDGMIGTCSVCKERLRLFATNYCPNCGAKMDGDRNDI